MFPVWRGVWMGWNRFFRALRLIRVLDVPAGTPARPDRRAPCPATYLDGLAARPGEGSGPGTRIARLRAVLVAALVVACGPVHAGGAPEAALAPRVGHAFALDSGELLYRERHEPEVAEGRLIADHVVYVDPASGEVFARKTVTYEPEALAPEFRLEDTRTGHVAGLTWRGGGRIELFEREREGASMRRTVLDAPADVIADTGFDLLIYRNLERLKAGETLQFSFAAPGEQDTVAFRLRRIARREVLGEPAVVIRMEPASMVLRWLAEPIDVAYHARTGALLRYEGVSNLPDPGADAKYRVRIDFPPEGKSPEPPGPAAAR